MKSIIITGAGSGLGKEMALLFSKKGYHILLTGRSIEKLTAVQEEIGDNADIFPLDIRNSAEVSKFAEEAGQKFQLVGLVNNAGVGHFGPFLDLTEQQLDDMLDTNVKGTILMTKAILPRLLTSQDGFILNIISTAGLRGKMNEAGYCASKFAVRGFTESLQKEYENTSVKITGVYMGGMDTPFWDDSDYIKDRSRLRSAKEVAEIILDQMNQESIVIEGKKS